MQGEGKFEFLLKISMDSTVQGTHSLIRFSFLGIYFEFSLNRGYLEDTMGKAWKKRTVSLFFLFPFETENNSAPERTKWPQQMENICLVMFLRIQLAQRVNIHI